MIGGARSAGALTSKPMQFNRFLILIEPSCFFFGVGVELLNCLLAALFGGEIGQFAGLMSGTPVVHQMVDLSSSFDFGRKGIMKFRASCADGTGERFCCGGDTRLLLVD